MASSASKILVSRCACLIGRFACEVVLVCVGKGKPENSLQNAFTFSFFIWPWKGDPKHWSTYVSVKMTKLLDVQILLYRASHKKQRLLHSVYFNEEIWRWKPFHTNTKGLIILCMHLEGDTKNRINCLIRLITSSHINQLLNMYTCS